MVLYDKTYAPLMDKQRLRHLTFFFFYPGRNVMTSSSLEFQCFPVCVTKPDAVDCTSCWCLVGGIEALVNFPFILSLCHSAGRMPSLDVNFLQITIEAVSYLDEQSSVERTA